MSKSTQPRLRDVRRVYRLLGECTEMGSDSTAWRTHLLAGTATIIGARLSFSMHLHRPLQHNKQLDAVVTSGFLDSEQQAL